MICKIYYSLLTKPLSASFRQTALALLTREDVEIVNRFRFWQDRDTTLMGRILLRKALLDCGLPGNPLLDIKSTPNGKPYLDDGYYFNISHSELLTVIVINESSEVGIDVEKAGSVNPSDFTNCFTDAEYSHICQTADPATEFYRLWTRKEAFLKAIGTGLSLPPGTIDALSDITWNNQLWFIRPILLAEGYLCHLASTCAHPEIILLPLDLNDSM